jgi:hypothetical protein
MTVAGDREAAHQQRREGKSGLCHDRLRPDGWSGIEASAG